MPVLFLDIDGVILPFNSTTLEHRFDERCVNVLNEVIHQTNCDIVLSSDWRWHYTFNELKTVFYNNNVIKHPIDLTMVKSDSMLCNLEEDRCFEINDWVKKISHLNGVQ